jgi:hypothetical protein
MSLGSRTFELTPQHPTEPSVIMRVLIFPMLASAFAVGAELGVIGVLSIWFSDATWVGHFIALDLIVVVAFMALYYIASTFQSATNPGHRAPWQRHLPGRRVDELE